jgi:hypothetical protein
MHPRRSGQAGRRHHPPHRPPGPPPRRRRPGARRRRIVWPRISISLRHSHWRRGRRRRRRGVSLLVLPVPAGRAAAQPVAAGAVAGAAGTVWVVQEPACAQQVWVPTPAPSRSLAQFTLNFSLVSEGVGCHVLMCLFEIWSVPAARVCTYTPCGACVLVRAQ